MDALDTFEYIIKITKQNLGCAYVEATCYPEVEANFRLLEHNSYLISSEIGNGQIRVMPNYFSRGFVTSRGEDCWCANHKD